MIKKILLACAGGLSTSMLVQRMEKAAKKKGIAIIIDAVAEIEIPLFIDQIDLLMLGPQTGHLEASFKKEYGKQIPIVTVDMTDYGMLNGEKVLNEALQIMK